MQLFKTTSFQAPGTDFCQSKMIFGSGTTFGTRLTLSSTKGSSSCRPIAMTFQGNSINFCLILFFFSKKNWGLIRAPGRGPNRFIYRIFQHFKYDLIFSRCCHFWVYMLGTPGEARNFTYDIKFYNSEIRLVQIIYLFEVFAFPLQNC